jgi:hypothetical protein
VYCDKWCFSSSYPFCLVDPSCARNAGAGGLRLRCTHPPRGHQPLLLMATRVVPGSSARCLMMSAYLAYRWSVIRNSSGRLIVSTTQPSYGGLFINEPLTDRKNRQHIHNCSASVSLPYHHVATLSHDNYDGARGTVSASLLWLPSLTPLQTLRGWPDPQHDLGPALCPAVRYSAPAGVSASLLRDLLRMLHVLPCGALTCLQAL